MKKEELKAGVAKLHSLNLGNENQVYKEGFHDGINEALEAIDVIYCESNEQDVQEIKEGQVFIDVKTSIIKAKVNLDEIIEALIALEAIASDSFNLDLEDLEFLKQVKALEVISR